MVVLVFVVIVVQSGEGASGMVKQSDHAAAPPLVPRRVMVHAAA
jgi:hypothetical protein